MPGGSRDARRGGRRAAARPQRSSRVAAAGIALAGLALISAVSPSADAQPPQLEIGSAVLAASSDAAYLDPGPTTASDVSTAATLDRAQPVTYELGTAAITGAGDGDRVAALQQRLMWLGIPGIRVDGQLDAATRTAIRALQAKAQLPQTGVPDALTVAALTRISRRGAQLDPRCLAPGRVICVDKTQKVLRYLVSGTVLRTLDATFGPERGDPGFGRYSRTREGAFRVYLRSAHHVSSDYATSMRWSLFFDGAEAMHFSEYFRDSGYAIRSFGCVELRDFAGARWVFRHSPDGTPFIVYH